MVKIQFFKKINTLQFYKSDDAFDDGNNLFKYSIIVL